MGRNKGSFVPLLTVLLLVLMVVAAGCGSSADGSGTEPVEQGQDQKQEQEAPEDNGDTEKESEPALGTRQNPVPIGTDVQVGPNWQIAVLEVNPDVWAVVQETNMFNDPPAEGRQFVMARVRVSYSGEESGIPWVDLRVRYLGSDGNTYGEGMDDYCGVIPEALSDIGEQFPGAVAEGNVCWSVPADVIAGGAIIIEETLSFEDTRVFFAGVE